MSFAQFTQATPEDLAAIDRLIKSPEPVERIHGWRNSQLSLARFAGCCFLNGVEYIVAFDEAGEPLVRADILKREAKEAKEARRAKNQGEVLQSAKAQRELL